MTVGAVVLDLTGAVNNPGTQVTLTWSASSDYVRIYTADGEFQTPDPGVDLLTAQGVSGGQSGGVGNGSAAQPNWGSCGIGGEWATATYLPNSLTYPVAVTVGTGGAAVPFAEQTSTGNPGTDTVFGPTSVGWYLRAYGGQDGQPNASFSEEQSSSFELGSVNGANTTHAGACGAGSNYLGSGYNPAGVCEDGPGGDGGGSGSSGQPGYSYGGGGGGQELNDSITGPSGAGAGGVLIVDATYAPADYYNIYRQGTLLATNVTALTYVDSSPISGVITYEVVSVISGVEQPQGAEYVTVTITQPPVTVPNLIGMTSSAASAAVLAAGLLVGTTGTQVLADGPYNVVSAQGPAAGTAVPVNTLVDYVIAVSPTAGAVAWQGPLTPSPNVEALSGIYGDQWGANGGGAEPIGGGVIGQTGWSDSVKVTVSDGQRPESYIIGTPNLSVGSQMSDTALEAHTPDNSLPTGGSII